MTPFLVHRTPTTTVKYQLVVVDGTAATVIWIHMIDFDFSAVAHPNCRWASAEVKLYTQHRCLGGWMVWW